MNEVVKKVQFSSQLKKKVFHSLHYKRKVHNYILFFFTLISSTIAYFNNNLL